MTAIFDQVDWPIVLPNDDGIRPAGMPDRCFYCGQRVGEPHGSKCAAVHKMVRVQYSFDIEIEVPAFWDKDNVEFHRNDSSWCANNAIGDIGKFLERIDQEDSNCLCGVFEAKFLGAVEPEKIYCKEKPTV